MIDEQGREIAQDMAQIDKQIRALKGTSILSPKRRNRL